MSAAKRGPAANRTPHRENDATNATSQNTASPEFMTSTGRSDGWPCGTYYVILCGDLGERLEELASRRGLHLDDLLREMIDEGLARENLITSLVNRGERS